MSAVSRTKRRPGLPDRWELDPAGYLDSLDDVDRYRIQVGQGQVVLASRAPCRATSTCGWRTRVAHRLPRAKAAVRPTRRSVPALPAGTYWVAVYSPNGDSSADTPYTLGVSVQGTVVVAINVDPNAPPPTAAAERPIEQLVLIGDEAGAQAKRSGSKRGDDGGCPGTR